MCTLTRAERFKDARTVHNIHGKQTMNAVQEATGVSASLIADLESDERSRKVNYMDVAKLAKHYGVTLDWLCGLSEDHHVNPCASSELGLSEKSIYFLKLKVTMMEVHMHQKLVELMLFLHRKLKMNLVFTLIL